MNRIVKFNINDILADSKAVSQILNKACARHIPMKVTGLCAFKDCVLTVLEEVDSADEHGDYVFASVPGLAPEEIAAQITGRYHADFSTIGTFSTEKAVWALFEHKDSSSDK